jgi:hypothetical protein
LRKIYSVCSWIDPEICVSPGFGDCPETKTKSPFLIAWGREPLE